MCITKEHRFASLNFIRQRKRGRDIDLCWWIVPLMTTHSITHTYIYTIQLQSIHSAVMLNFLLFRLLDMLPWLPNLNLQFHLSPSWWSVCYYDLILCNDDQTVGWQDSCHSIDKHTWYLLQEFVIIIIIFFKFKFLGLASNRYFILFACLSWPPPLLLNGTGSIWLPPDVRSMMNTVMRMERMTSVNLRRMSCSSSRGKDCWTCSNHCWW